MDVDNLTEILMSKLIELDGIVVDGDLELQRRVEEKSGVPLVATKKFSKPREVEKLVVTALKKELGLAFKGNQKAGTIYSTLYGYLISFNDTYVIHIFRFIFTCLRLSCLYLDLDRTLLNFIFIVNLF